MSECLGTLIFITTTTNPNWPEIKDNLLPGQDPQNCPGIVARVLRLKSSKVGRKVKARNNWLSTITGVDWTGLLDSHQNQELIVRAGRYCNFSARYIV